MGTPPADAIESVNWPVVAASMLAVVACVMIHYEVLRLMGRWVLRRTRHRYTVAMVVLGLLAAHMIEILVFGATMATLMAWFGERIGRLEGDFAGPVDFGYFSSTVYTTVGFGDITPEGPIRLLVGVEALTGLVLITWSASFTFLVMQAQWKGRLKKDDA